MNRIIHESVKTDLELVRLKSPLVHNITNYVVMNNTANALLAIGASPVMAHAVEEVEDMVKIASSLVINIGTLSTPWIEAMMRAGKAANALKIPVVLDPVGAGATPFRNETCLRLIKECRFSVIRGNASEIMALVNERGKTKGVDSIDSSSAALQAAKTLHKETGAVVVVSGPVDYIIDSDLVIGISNGSPLMGRVTGLGCTATALIGAFIAVNNDFTRASAHAMSVMGIAGELAAEKSSGPGTLQMHFLDELYNLSGQGIADRLNVQV